MMNKRVIYGVLAVLLVLGGSTPVWAFGKGRPVKKAKNKGRRREEPVRVIQQAVPLDASGVNASLEKAGIDRLLLVVRNYIESTHIYTYFNEDFDPGGGLYLYENGSFIPLVEASGSQILDAELSYDGTTVLFSWKKNSRTNYDIYTIKLDGSELTQLTKHPANDFNATWLPDGGIAFLSDRDDHYAYCHWSSSAVLYRMDRGATEVKRLSANYLSDITPHVRGDGKILYTRWEYVDRFQIPSQGLWAQNPDGTGLTHVYGGRMLEPVTLLQARTIPGSDKLVSILTGHGGPTCGGVGVIDPSMGANNPAALKVIRGSMVTLPEQGMRTADQLFEFPCPVNDEWFLLSNDGAIELCSYDGCKVESVLKRGQGPAMGTLGFYAAMPVRPRPRDPMIQSSLPEESSKKTATLVMQDVYIGLEKELAEGTIKRGEIKSVRVIQSLGKDDTGSRARSAFCLQFPVVSAGATMEPKKTVSVVPVEADGSAMFEVPAMEPVILQALDAEGRTIQRMRTFAQFMPGEVQSCTGCHANRNTAAPASTTRLEALKKPVQPISGAPWREHELGFSYAEQVQPIWDRHCIRCHNAKEQPGGIDMSGDRTDLFNVSYDNLTRMGDYNADPSRTRATPGSFTHPYISFIPSNNGLEEEYMTPEYFAPKSWGSYQSKLAELVRTGHKDGQGRERIQMTPLEKNVVFAWIDYNIPYYPTSHTNHKDLSHGMRELVPTDYDQLLMEVAERRCAECHEPSTDRVGWFSWNDKKKATPRRIPRKHYLRWEKPELNNFMLAPLAKEAGGTEMCGRSVFKDKNDPDYQKLLRAFDSINKRVGKLPRMDMPGAKKVRSEEHISLYTDKERP